ncbi:unnamed protein product [Closterium sp. Yama58-4]|nr:unnamed protein product [Closterium sp. Yama58-4]
MLSQQPYLPHQLHQPPFQAQTPHPLMLNEAVSSQGSPQTTPQLTMNLNQAMVEEAPCHAWSLPLSRIIRCPQNISALQSLIPLMAQQQQQQPIDSAHAEQLKQQHAAASAGVASIISQLALAAANILPQMGLPAPINVTPATIPPATVTSGAFQSGSEVPQGTPAGFDFQNLGFQMLESQSRNVRNDDTATAQVQLSLVSLTPAAAESVKLQQNQLKSVISQKEQQQHLCPPAAAAATAAAHSAAAAADVRLSRRGYVATRNRMDPVELLAEHTHFCEICGKGFKRDANLRMHMRGHGDEYKTPEALANPDKTTLSRTNPTVAAEKKPLRYSCPFVGCKRNQQHRAFVPLKTMLCVKNHYRRTHCPKMLSCSKCGAKRFSVVADLKTHEKHCGRDRWLCSCGTSFSRKDKLLGHLALFKGHRPANPSFTAVDDGPAGAIADGTTGGEAPAIAGHLPGKPTLAAVDDGPAPAVAPMLFGSSFQQPELQPGNQPEQRPLSELVTADLLGSAEKAARLVL